MDKYKIDENYYLIIYVDEDNKLKITEELLNEIKEHIFFKVYKNFSERKITNMRCDDITISFKFCNIPFEILDPPISCNFIKENKIILVYSKLHLKLILKKIKYNSPYYLSNQQKIFLNVENINLLNEQKLIIINDEDENKKLISQYFHELKKLYTMDMNWENQHTNLLQLILINILV